MRFILKNGMYGDVPNLVTPQQTFNDTACWNYIMQRRKNLGYFGWNSREAKEYVEFKKYQQKVEEDKRKNKRF